MAVDYPLNVTMHAGRHRSTIDKDSALGMLHKTELGLFIKNGPHHRVVCHNRQNYISVFRNPGRIGTHVTTQLLTQRVSLGTITVIHTHKGIAHILEAPGHIPTHSPHTNKPYAVLTVFHDFSFPTLPC